jgi:ribosome biogenesis GTPase / thiamine phosphate phosphatase
MAARAQQPRAAADAGRLPGVVIATFRRHYIVELDDGERIDCLLKGRVMTLACGDRVQVRRVAGGGAVEAVEPRTSLFYRSDAFREKLIAANVTQVIGVVAPDVSIDEHLLNRWIIAAEAEGCRFLLVANKSDLPDFPALTRRLAPYAALGYRVVELSARLHADALLPWIAGQQSVLIGQSGMGKSTILNAVDPEAAARTNTVSAALVAGRHTTSSTRLFRLPAGGWLVDSPGMSVFGLAHYPRETLEQAFVELRTLAGHCRFRDCMHDREPGCAVQAALAARTIAPQRVALLQALIRESAAAHDPAR